MFIPSVRDYTLVFDVYTNHPRPQSAGSLSVSIKPNDWKEMSAFVKAHKDEPLLAEDLPKRIYDMINGEMLIWYSTRLDSEDSLLDYCYIESLYTFILSENTIEKLLDAKYLPEYRLYVGNNIYHVPQQIIDALLQLREDCPDKFMTLDPEIEQELYEKAVAMAKG